MNKIYLVFILIILSINGSLKASSFGIDFNFLKLISNSYAPIKKRLKASDIDCLRVISDSENVEYISTSYSEEFNYFFDEIFYNELDHNEYEKFYKEKENILILSDGEPIRIHSQLTPIISKLFKDKNFTQTDFSYTGDERDGNVRKIHLDNRELFPFSDNEFDLILLKNGLCQCENVDKTCCGLTKDNYKLFFTEIIRVLNTSNKEARAYLHSAGFVHHEVFKLWIEEAKSVMKEFPHISIQFQVSSENRLDGIIFKVKE